MYRNNKVGFFITYSYEQFDLNPNTWYFVGYSSNGMSGLHYVCDSSSHSVPFYPDFDTSLGKIRVGLGIGPEELTNPENLFIGNVVSLGIWDRELSNDEVQTLYHAGRVTYTDLPSELKTSFITELSNAQVKLKNISNLQARSVVIQNLQSTGISGFYQAARFDGSSQITINSAPTNVVTVSVWIKYTGLSGNGPVIIKGNNQWNSFQWDWGIWADSGFFYVTAITGPTFCSVGHDNTSWHHLVLVRDNGSETSDFYMNGTYMASGTGSNQNNFDNTMYAGGVNGQYLTGEIGEIQLFSTALSSSDIANIYNSGNGVYGSCSDVGLISGYHLSGDATNYSTLGDNGVWSGTTQYATGAILNVGYKAADFDGSSQIIVNSAPTDVNSISLWVNSTIGSNFGAIITKGNNVWDSSHWDWGLWHDGGSGFYAGTAIGLISSYYYTYNTWYHIVMVLNDGNGASHFYINGSLIGSSDSCLANNYDNTIYIGGTGNNFLGQIEEVQLFNRALSSEEVTFLYNSGNGIYGSSSDVGLVAGYHLNGNATDYSTSANNGYWNGTETYAAGIVAVASVLENINASNGFALEALTQVSLDDLETSNGVLQITKPTIENIITSTGATLQFGSKVSSNSGIVGFWNMTEESGTRYDSVGENHLEEVDVVALFTFSTPIGRGNSTTFTDTSTLAVSWLWDFGDETTSTSQNPSHTYSTDGTHTVTLTINGGVRSISHNIVVEEPVASFTDNSPQNFGTPITFTDTSTYAVSWLWDFGDETTSTNQNPSHTYSTDGNYTITLEINGNISNTSGSVTVNKVESYVWDKVDLSSYYNMIGFVAPGFNYTSLPNYGLDGYSGDIRDDIWGTGGYAMNANDFGSSPKELFNVEFDTPEASDGNDVNNTIRCTGQIIPLHGGQYTELRLLGFITNASHRDVSFVITYSDTSTDTINQSMSDWFYGHANNFDNEEVAVTMSTRISSLGVSGSANVYVYEYYLPLDSTKNVVSITLPSTEFTFICSITQASSIVQPLAWIKADSLTLNDDDVLSTWPDRSGSSNNFTQSNSAFKPIFKENILNGYPAIKFDGVNDYMYTTLNAANNYSVIAVYKQLTTGAFSIAVSWGSGVSGKTFWSGYILGTANSGHLIPASDSHVDNVSDSINDTNWHLIDGIFDGTHIIGRDFGVLATPVLNEPSDVLSGQTATIGAYGASPSLFWNGYIAEVLFFNTNLSDTNRTLIESYLQHKYELINRNEIQVITFNQTATSGTFTITVNGQTTDPIPYDSDATNIQTYINTALGANNTSVS